MSENQQLSRAVAQYVEKHRGELPGRGWKQALVEIDPALNDVVSQREDDWQTGFAAIPGTLGKKLGDLNPETVLYVGYRSQSLIDVLTDTGDLGTVSFPGRGLVVTVENVNGSSANGSWPIGKIGFQLGRQGAPGLK